MAISVTFYWKNGKSHNVKQGGQVRGLIDSSDHTRPCRYSVFVDVDSRIERDMQAIHLDRFFRSCNNALGLIGTIGHNGNNGTSETT